jgi:4-amino-4-deoxy-L-arabinose transferase-like glycosyltransferase
MVAVLLLGAWVAVFHLDRDSIWYDEGFTAYIVHDDHPEPDGIRETLRYFVGSLVGVFERGRGDVHPLLYYGIIDIWTWFMGDSVWMLRLPSVFFGLIGLSATYTLGRTLFDRPTGLLGALLLSVAHFYVYYNREARMYTLLVVLAVLFLLAMIRWYRQPTIRHSLIMGLAMGLLMHTHYIGAWVILTALLFQAYAIIRRHTAITLGHWLLPHLIGFIIFLPWLPFTIEQIITHPNGPLGQAVASTTWGTLVWLWDMMTTRHAGILLAGFVLGGGIFTLRRRHIQDAVVLLVLWFLVPSIGLLLVHESGRAVFVARYLLVSLPALMLIGAYGLRHITSTPSLLSRLKPANLRYGFGLIILVWLIIAQLTMYSTYWDDKPRWQDALASLQDTRQADEPAIINLPPHHVATYYARHYAFTQGIAIDIGWADFVPEQLQDFVARLRSADAIWAILPSDSDKTWHTLHSLAEGRTIGYRDSVQNMLFYRFDQSDTSTLAQFDFGFYNDNLGRFINVTSTIGHHYYAETGTQFCFPLQLEASQAVTDNWHLLISLTQGYNTPHVEITQDLPALAAGEPYDETLCLDIPVDTPRGPHLLRVALRNSDRVHQPVVESDQNLFWGYFVGMAWVSVDHPT